MTFYLYHWVPDDMEGNTLYPLNVLKEKYPQLYDKKAGRYTGREEVMKWFIPNLNCFWNDVLHLSAIHPKVVKEALKEAGYKGEHMTKCYQIDPHLLNPENTIVYLYNSEAIDGQFDPDNFVAFNPDEIEKYSTIPERTKQHYKKRLENKRMPLTFAGAPHILFKGLINIENLPIVQG
jgi:hypothetical protein